MGGHLGQRRPQEEGKSLLVSLFFIWEGKIDKYKSIRDKCSHSPLGHVTAQVIQPGTPDSRPTKGCTVVVKASGQLEDGTVVDSHDQLTFTLGDGEVSLVAEEVFQFLLMC